MYILGFRNRKDWCKIRVRRSIRIFVGFISFLKTLPRGCISIRAFLTFIPFAKFPCSILEKASDYLFSEQPGVGRRGRRRDKEAGRWKLLLFLSLSFPYFSASSASSSPTFLSPQNKPINSSIHSSPPPKVHFSSIGKRGEMENRILERGRDIRKAVQEKSTTKRKPRSTLEKFGASPIVQGRFPGKFYSSELASNGLTCRINVWSGCPFCI